MVDRDRQLTIRVSTEEVAMLRELAEKEGVSSSDLLRLYIRRTYAETFGREKPKRTK